jgi:choline dehydrogenase-like flavoprotein
VSTLPAAARTGRFTLVTNAQVREVTTAGGRATGVAYVDTATGQDMEVSAKVVVLCASTLGSTRILLASKSGGTAEGLGNSSGVLGRYLTDHHFVSGARGVIPQRRGAQPELAQRPNGIYIPRFRNVKTKDAEFLRGYGYQGGENVTVYEHAYSQPGFGAAWKESLRGQNVSRFTLTGFGETLPRYENRCTLDPEVKDKWGIPVLRFDCVFGENEAAMSKDMEARAAEMLEAAGCEQVEPYRTTPPPGFCIHEVGTARMGDDPKTSVVNAFQQTHDLKNLFVMDGSSFVSIGCVNPTLTMMALTVRSSRYLSEAYKRGELA